MYRIALQVNVAPNIDADYGIAYVSGRYYDRYDNKCVSEVDPTDTQLTVEAIKVIDNVPTVMATSTYDISNLEFEVVPGPEPGPESLTLSAATGTVRETSVSDMQDITIDSETDIISGTSYWLDDEAIAVADGAGNYIALECSDIDPSAVSVEAIMQASDGTACGDPVDVLTTNPFTFKLDATMVGLLITQTDSEGNESAQAWGLNITREAETNSDGE